MKCTQYNNHLKKVLAFTGIFCLTTLCFISLVIAQATNTVNDPANKTITFGNQKLKLKLDYNRKANISYLEVNGQKVIDGAAGVYSEIKTASAIYNTLNLSAQPVLKLGKNSIKIEGIKYGDKDLTINETWIFTTSDKAV